MYEKKSDPVAPFSVFLWRVFQSCLVGLIIVASALFIGTMGYHFTEDLAWLDSFFNAALVLSDMGPVVPMATPYGKIFEASYALFCGIMFVSIMSVILAPILHRFLHAFMRIMIKIKKSKSIK